MIGALSRSYVLHRLCKGLFGNSVLQVAMEAALIPAVLDSRLAVWLRTVLRQIRTRAEALKAQDAVVAELPTVTETVVQDQAIEQLLDEEELEEQLVETPVPMNRAERRAAERQQRKHRPALATTTPARPAPAEPGFVMSREISCSCCSASPAPPLLRSSPTPDCGPAARKPLRPPPGRSGSSPSVVLICTKAVESVVDTLDPHPRPRMASEGVYGGYQRPLVDTWDEE